MSNTGQAKGVVIPRHRAGIGAGDSESVLIPKQYGRIAEWVNKHIRSRHAHGAGALFPPDYLVASQWATEVATGRGTEGQVVYTYQGCPVVLYSTVQAAVTAYAAASAAKSIYIAPGTYNESVDIPTNSYKLTIIGFGMDDVMVGGTGKVMTVGNTEVWIRDLSVLGTSGALCFTQKAGTTNMEVHCERIRFLHKWGGDHAGSTFHDCIWEQGWDFDGQWEPQTVKIFGGRVDNTTDMDFTTCGAGGAGQWTVVGLDVGSTAQLILDKVVDSYFNMHFRTGGGQVNDQILFDGDTSTGIRLDCHFSAPVSEGQSVRVDTGTTVRNVLLRGIFEYTAAAAHADTRHIKVDGVAENWHIDCSFQIDGTGDYIEDDGGKSVSGVFVNSKFTLTPTTAEVNTTGASSGNVLDSGVLTAGSDGTGPPSIAAPYDAQYLVLALHDDLTAERRFVPGTGLTATDDGANGDYHLDPDWAELGDLAAVGAAAAAGSTAEFPYADHVHALGIGTTRGDLLVWEATPVASRLAIGGAGTLLQSDGTDPAWVAPATAIGHAMLDGSIHTDSVADAVSRGSLLIGNATPKWDELNIGANGTFLRSDAWDPYWGQIAEADISDLQSYVLAHAMLDGSAHSDSVADGVTAGSIIIGNDTPKWDELDITVPAANILNVLGVVNGETVPSWKAIHDATAAADTSTAGAAGTSLLASHRDHVHKLHDHDHTGDAGDGAQIAGASALSDIGIADDNMVQVDGPGAGAPANGEYAKWTANGLEGKTAAEVMGDLGFTASATELETAVITFIIDGGGEAITTGIKGDLWIPFACTVKSWRLLADQAGAIVIDVWNKADGAGNYPPANGEAMPGGGKEPTISASDDYAEDDDVTDWASTSIAAETTLRFNVDSCATIERVTLALKVEKT